MLLQGATGFLLTSKVSGRELALAPHQSNEDQAYAFELSPDSLGEWVLTISYEVRGRAREAQLSFFVIPPDWRGLRPYRGDLHVHTNYSDGRQSPLTMAIRGRELGMDFLAITDHNYYASSREAQEEAARWGLALLLLAGEEVTVAEPSAGGGHILSIEASGSVTDQRDAPGYEEERASIVKELEARELVRGLSTDLYVPTLWTVRKIHELGGRAYLAHPYWVHRDCFHLYRPIYEQLLKDGEFDGIELLGDVRHEDNILSLARYHETLRDGPTIPIIGNSDTHREAHTFGRTYSIAFAPRLEAQVILGAVAALRSVACQRRPSGERDIFGTFPWVEYALFLEREYFPAHDALCQLEAQLVRQKVLNNDTTDHTRMVRQALQQEGARFWGPGE